MKFNHPIYPITNKVLSGLNHKDQVEILVQTGVDLIQLREKTAVTREFYADAKEAVAVGRRAGVKIIINDRVDIALALGADGVHLGQDDLSPLHAREILGADAIVGYSTHTVEQAKAAKLLPVDYIAFGPVFDTSTKADPDAVTGIDSLQNVRSSIGDIPLVAIGGICDGNITEIAAAGADAAAIISAIFESAGRIKENVAMLRQSW